MANTPATTEDITADWLTAALQESGVIGKRGLGFVGFRGAGFAGSWLPG